MQRKKIFHLTLLAFTLAATTKTVKIKPCYKEDEFFISTNVIYNNLEEFKKHIAENPGFINSKSQDNVGINPIHILCKNGMLEFIKYLVSLDKNVINQKDNFLRTTMHYACLNNQLKIVEFLFEQDKNLFYQQDDLGGNSMHHACSKDYTDVIKFILKNDKKNILFTKDIDGHGPIYHASNETQQIISDYLLSIGKSSEYVEKLPGVRKGVIKVGLLACCNNSLFFPKMWAIAKELLESKTSSQLDQYGNLYDDQGDTPLILAIKANQTEVAKLILEKNQETKFINAKNKKNQTALLWACFKKNWKIVELLIAKGAKKSIIIADDNGTKALDYAFSYKENKILKLFLNECDLEDINCELIKKESPLSLCCKHDYPDLVKLLVSRGVTVKQDNIKKSTNLEIKILLQSCLEFDTRLQLNNKEAFLTGQTKETKKHLNLFLNRAISIQMLKNFPKKELS